MQNDQNIEWINWRYKYAHTKIKDKRYIQLLLLDSFIFVCVTHHELLERTISPALLETMWPALFFPFFSSNKNY